MQYRPQEKCQEVKHVMEEGRHLSTTRVVVVRLRYSQDRQSPTYIPNRTAPCRNTTQLKSRYGVTCVHALMAIVVVFLHDGEANHEWKRTCNPTSFCSGNDDLCFSSSPHGLCGFLCTSENRGSTSPLLPMHAVGIDDLFLVHSRVIGAYPDSPTIHPIQPIKATVLCHVRLPDLAARRLPAGLCIIYSGLIEDDPSKCGNSCSTGRWPETVTILHFLVRPVRDRRNLRPTPEHRSLSL